MAWQVMVSWQIANDDSEAQLYSIAIKYLDTCIAKP